MAWSLRACACMPRYHVELLNGKKSVDAIFSRENGITLINFLSGDGKMTIDEGEQLKEGLRQFRLPKQTPPISDEEVAAFVHQLAPLGRGVAEGKIEDSVQLRQITREDGRLILDTVYMIRSRMREEKKSHESFAG